MSEAIWGIDMNNSTTSWNLDKHLCKNTGLMCELATEFGYCQITACIKRNCGTGIDNIEYGIYKIPDKNEVPPTHACCICDEYENKKASIAYVDGWICPECKRRLNQLLYPNCKKRGRKADV